MELSPPVGSGPEVDEVVLPSPSYLVDQRAEEDHVPAIDRVQIARETYGAYESGDRTPVEKHLSPDFRFYSPADVGIDLPTYFERCWPNAEMIAAFEFVRIIESGDEVVVTYEATKTDGQRFRNTEILGFDGDQIIRAEVYFGWDLGSGS